MGDNMPRTWRALFFKKADDLKPTRTFVIAASGEEEAELIACRIMLDYERVDLIRTFDKSRTIPIGKFQLIES